MTTKKKTTMARATLPGSEKPAPAAKKGRKLAGDEVIEVTLRLRRKKSIDEALKAMEQTGKTYTREEYQQEFGLKDDDVEKVDAFAAGHGLSVTHISYGRRSVIVRGTAENMANAFGVQLNYFQAKGGMQFRGRSGAISVPKELKNIVEGVFGLDNRPQATPKFKRLQPSKGRILAQAHSSSFYPNELATLYNYPKADGTGQCIGIIELGGGHKLKDLQVYFDKIGIPMPTVKSVSVDGAVNKPGSDADAEVMLDIEVAGAIAPKATIVVYYAPNTDKGFLDAITQAVHDNVNKPSIISISWGAPEKEWTKQSMTNYNEAFKAAALLGVTVCAAAGDAGSADGETDGKAHADFPASSPYVLACGGTRLTADNGKVASEVVWHVADDSATGGGVSEFFKKPGYQQQTKIPTSVNNRFTGRGLPDVSGVADPNTGYKVYVDGSYAVIGGTSAVAPLMAGLVARLNQLKKKPVGFIHSGIYKNPVVFRDITQGDNITTTTGKGYKAGVGWDGCTGLGVADGKKLLEIF
jgi:kumamolisin